MYITVSEATRQKIEHSRESWAEIAKKFGWYFEPFYIQVWIDEFGEVVDTVGHKVCKIHAAIYSYLMSLMTE